MRFDLKTELRQILSDEDVRRRMFDALLKEATVGNKSGSVIRAFELIREMLEEDEQTAAIGNSPDELSKYSDEELRAMIEELERGE